VSRRSLKRFLSGQASFRATRSLFEECGDDSPALPGIEARRFGQAVGMALNAAAGRAVIISLCLSVIFAGISCGRGPSRDGDRPNIILISIDTLRADHIHGYGYARETTPTLDGLMRRGTSFFNAISSSPWTLPSHASLFTSLYPHTHGVTSEFLALDEEVATLPVLLRDSGYATAGFATMPHLSPRHGFGRGFDAYVCEEVRGVVALERALKWLAQVEHERFFLFLHLFDVHTDYSPQAQYLRMFESSYEGDVDGRGETLYRVREGELALSEEDIKHLTALYDAEIRQLDSALGMFFKALEQRNMLSSSVVIVTSDHGEEFLDHGGVLHGQTLYDELVKVPLIIAGRGIPAGRSVKEQVQVIDIMPTILELCGARIPRGLEGRSLLPLVLDENPEWTELAFMEADWRNEKHDIKRAVRTGRYKLYYDRHTKREELYDLAVDPAEKQNIVQARPEVAESLRGKLKEWMATERGRPRSIRLTDKERERLRALGYLD